MVLTIPIVEIKYAATPGAHSNPLILIDTPKEKNVNETVNCRLNRNNTPRYENNV